MGNNKPTGKGKAADKGKAKAGDKAKAKDDASSSSTKLKPATAINVRHILCTKLTTKDAALASLQTGRSFSDVAREFSEDKARQGGSLGWKTRGSLLQEFEKVAYELEVSSVGKPKIGEVKTGEGYHVMMVEGRR